jgi:hypothetical protein
MRTSQTSGHWRLEENWWSLSFEGNTSSVRNRVKADALDVGEWFTANSRAARIHRRTPGFYVQPRELRDERGKSPHGRQAPQT